MKRLFAILLTLMLVLSGCSSGVPQEEYDALVAENQLLKEQLAQYDAEFSASDNEQTTDIKNNEENCPIEIIAQEPTGTEYGYSHATFTVKNVSGQTIHALTLDIKILDENQVVLSTTHPQEGVLIADGESIVFEALTEEGAYSMKLDEYSFYTGEDYDGDYIQGHFSNTEEVVLN